MSEIVKEVLFLRPVQALTMPALESNPVDIVEDNQGAINVANNRYSSKRMRNIDVGHHLIRDAVDEGRVRVNYVKTEDQHADMLTKPLDNRMFEKHVDALMNAWWAFWGEWYIFVSSSEVGEEKWLDRFLRGNFSRKFWGWRGQKFLGGKKTFLTRKFSGKISSLKISSGNFDSNSPSRRNFEAQNFLETRGNFTRKFWDHLIIELKSVPFPSTG